MSGKIPHVWGNSFISQNLWEKVQQKVEKSPALSLWDGDQHKYFIFFFQEFVSSLFGAKDGV